MFYGLICSADHYTNIQVTWVFFEQQGGGGYPEFNFRDLDGGPPHLIALKSLENKERVLKKPMCPRGVTKGTEVGTFATRPRY